MITIRTEGHGQHIVYHAYHTPRHRLCCSSTVVHHAPRMPHTSPILPIYNLLLHLLRLRKLLKLHPLDNNYCCAATTATTLEPLLQPLLWNYCYSHYFGTTAATALLQPTSAVAAARGTTASILADLPLASTHPGRAGVARCKMRQPVDESEACGLCVCLRSPRTTNLNRVPTADPTLLLQPTRDQKQNRANRKEGKTWEEV